MSRQEPTTPESYSTFWDVVPDEVSDTDAPEATDDGTYSDGPASQLNVEPIDA